MQTDDETFQLGFEAGCSAARAGMAGDIRAVIDYFNSEMRQLRLEICQLAGLPSSVLAPPDGQAKDRPQ